MILSVFLSISGKCQHFERVKESLFSFFLFSDFEKEKCLEGGKWFERPALSLNETTAPGKIRNEIRFLLTFQSLKNSGLMPKILFFFFCLKQIFRSPSCHSQTN